MTNPQPARRARAQYIATRLAALRRDTGLSLPDVETESGGAIAAARLGSYERRHRAVSIDALYELAEFYGVSVWSILPPDNDRARELTVLHDVVRDAHQILGREVDVRLRWPTTQPARNTDH